MRKSIAGLAILLAALFVTLVKGTPANAQEHLPDPVTLTVEMKTTFGERRRAGVGDIVHEDFRQVAAVRIVPTRDALDVCDDGWCHNFRAGVPLVFSEYGHRIFCTGEKTGQRDTMFSDYPSYSCVIRDRMTGEVSGLFGLKEFEESIRVVPGELPRSVSLNVDELPLTAYPDWLTSTGRNYLDGVYRVRYAGVDGSHVLFDIEHEPEIDGSQPALVQRIRYPLGMEGDPALPLAREGADYSEVDMSNIQSDAISFSGIRIKVHSADSSSLEYEVSYGNELLQIQRNGHWLVRNDGTAIEVTKRYQ